MFDGALWVHNKQPMEKGGDNIPSQKLRTERNIKGGSLRGGPYGLRIIFPRNKPIRIETTERILIN